MLTHLSVVRSSPEIDVEYGLEERPEGLRGKEPLWSREPLYKWNLLVLLYQIWERCSRRLG
jgi:hypothetical protein